MIFHVSFSLVFPFTLGPFEIIYAPFKFAQSRPFFNIAHFGILLRVPTLHFCLRPSIPTWLKSDKTSRRAVSILLALQQKNRPILEIFPWPCHCKKKKKKEKNWSFWRHFERGWEDNSWRIFNLACICLRAFRYASHLGSKLFPASVYMKEVSQTRSPFLESPQTFRAYFGWHNSLCIFKTKASQGTRRCSYFNFCFLYNISKDQQLLVFSYVVKATKIQNKRVWVSRMPFRDFRETGPRSLADSERRDNRSSIRVTDYSNILSSFVKSRRHFNDVTVCVPLFSCCPTGGIWWTNGCL